MAWGHRNLRGKVLDERTEREMKEGAGLFRGLPLSVWLMRAILGEEGLREAGIKEERYDVYGNSCSKFINSKRL